MRSIALAAAIGVAAITAGGCATPAPDHYYWGAYEASVDGVLRDPSGERLQNEIRSLSGDIEKARVAGLTIAPGVHAHLGYLYYLGGNYESAALEFTAEKELFPESAVFIDGILARMKK